MLTVMPPTTPLLFKRSRFDEFEDESYLPKSKRRHLCSNPPLNGYGIQLRSRSEKQNRITHHEPSVKRSALLKAQLQLSSFFKEENSAFPKQGVSDHDVSLATPMYLSDNCHKSRSGDVESAMEVVDLEEGDKTEDEIPVVNLKRYGVRLSEPTLSAPSDVESDSSESSRTSIPKSRIKQPAIVLMKVNQTVKKKPAASAASALPSPCPKSPEFPNVVFGGYVHRMASLNARACVAAYLEPEKKFTPKCFLKKEKSKNSNSLSSISHEVEIKKDEPRVQPEPESQKSPKEEAIEEIITSEVDALPKSPTESGVVIKADYSEVSINQCDYEVEGSFNKDGLLYNGDSIHPNAQIFLAGLSKLKLPAKVLPTLVPARLSTVKRATQQAISTGVVHSDKKQNKKNNGWCPLGDPIKVIEYNESSLKKKTRKYFAGIRRKREDIFVRDCVVIKAGEEDNEKPYVAKIGGIWQEPDGHLMMTTFWYYRLDDVKLQNPTVNCVGRELLASQHHDTNSVACIEDKCYVLGFSQYCRYHASVVKSTIINPLSGHDSPKHSVPEPTLSATTGDHHHLDKENVPNNLMELDPTKLEFSCMSPPLSELQGIDPFLVFLCYRGFNHISGKVQNGKMIKV